MKKWCAACGLDQYEKEGQEADDVIASIITRIRQKDDKPGNIIIYSNDRDFLQLVEPRVIVYRPKRGATPEKFYDEDAVREEFGVPPNQVACFRSFDKDTSDGIKGVDRVPRKIIASLVLKHGNADIIYKCLDDEKLTDFQRKAFLEAEERVRMNLKLVTLDRNIEDLRLSKTDVDEEAMKELLLSYEIKSVDTSSVADLFSSTLNVRYSDPTPSYKLETYSLF